MTYAELCLARPTTLSTVADSKLNNVSGLGFGSGVIVGGKAYTKEATVYACIDHSARSPKLEQDTYSTNVTPIASNPFPETILGKQHHPREVVTVRTPLISTQESCV